jgi:hypothetical protein
VRLALSLDSANAQVNMPDPALIHGKAIPAPELSPGTVTVRVVRESIGNNLAAQEVRVTSGSTKRTAKTDEQGRAEFSNLQLGVEARAEATVAGEQLVSDPFVPPSSGGLRVILVAGLKTAAARREKEAAEAAAAPPVRGAVVFGPNSRVMMEFRDDRLQVFYVLDVLNNARARVDIGGPLILDLPSGAAGAATLEGTTPNATVSGDRVTVTGPFQPGNTSVQIGFQLLYDTPQVTLEQRWPAAMEQLTVAMEKVGTAAMSSPQFSTVGEVNAGDGTPYLLGNGPPLPANATLSLQLSNLPVHDRTPRLVALGIAGALLATGAWLAFSARSRGQDNRRRLLDRRNTLLGDLATVEERLRRRPDARDAARRQRLITELEQIYGELDEEGAGPQGGGEGVAA